MVLSSLCQLAGIKHRGSKIPVLRTYDDFVLIGKGADITAYYTDKAYRTMITSGDYLLKKKNALLLFRKSAQFRHQYDKFIKSLKSIKPDKLSNKELKNLLSRVWDYEAEGLIYFCASQEEPLKAAELHLRDFLGKYYKEEKINLILEKLLYLPTFDKIIQQEFDWYELVRKNSSFTRALFDGHISKYPFLLRNTFNLDKNYRFYQKRFKMDKRHIGDLGNHLKEIRVKQKVASREQKKILGKMGSRAAYLVWLFHKSALERMELKYTWAGVDEYLARDLYVEAAKRIGVHHEKLMRYYRINEVSAALLKGTMIHKREMKARDRGYVFAFDRGKPIFYAGSRATKFVETNYEFADIAGNEIKGNPASPGLVRGRVLIVWMGDTGNLGAIDRKFKKGMILVTGMTQPNMVPLMRKAGAILTDEGGLTSHAAVVSRELGVPCIVGTKVATQVLKDGDIVEVNANHGWVRKIK